MVVPTGATFNYVLPIRVTNGSINGGATTVTIPQGGMESEVLTVTRTADTTAHVTVDIGAFPRLPINHYGYALIKSDSLPLAVIRGINTAPVFSDGTTATRSIAENTARGVNIGTPVFATDTDRDRLTYSLSGIDASTFGIISSSGQLQTRAALDYETRASYSVTVAVSDGYGGSDSIAVVINITDVHENRAPVFTDGATTTRTIAENTASGQHIGAAVSATDADNDILTYTLRGPDAASFGIDSTSGRLQTKAALDYETKIFYLVTVSVSDGNGGSDSIIVVIRVTDVHENRAPVFTDGASTTRTIAENTASGQHIGAAVSATDADNDILTYTLRGPDAASFGIDSTSGRLQTKAALDYETKISYSVTVSVSDGNGGSDSITVTINVTDVHENRTPVFTEGVSTTRTIAENTEAGSNIGDAVSATDQDAKDTLTYTLSGTDAAAFDIDSKTGQIKTKAALDFETKNTYSVTLAVSDGLATGTIAVTINVIDVDENRAPAFTEGNSATRTVVENTTAGTNIGNAIAATDPDKDTVTYRLGGQDASAFNIDTNTGQLKTSAALDYETKAIYSVSVTASDGKLTAIIAVTINVTDVEELPTVTEIEEEVPTNNAPESTEGTSGTGVVVEDTVINETAAQNTVTDVPETAAQSTVTDVPEVSANDPPTNNAPVFTDGSSTTRSVAENTASGTNIGSAVFATDADNDTLTYSLSGTDASSFSIVSISGQLQTSAALDYEAKSSYTVTVSVSDGNGGSDSITVTINVTDVPETAAQNTVTDVPETAARSTVPDVPEVSANDPPTNNAPVFTDGSSTTRSVAENTASGTNIGSAVFATDADNDTLTYSLSGTDASSFSIVSISGQLQTSAALDYEAKSSYTVTVSVSDGNGGSDSITVTINVTDVPETAAQNTVTDVPEVPANDPPTNNAPEFTEGTSTTRSIAENTASGSNIGSAVSATDADNDPLTYSLSGTDASSFSIVSTSGQLQTSGALDYEAKSSYSVTVSVSDSNGGSDSITVTINVTDVPETPTQNTVTDVPETAAHSTVTDVPEVPANDPPTNNAPEFTEGSSTTRSVAENTASGQSIGSAVSATDANNDTLTYSLSGTDASSFSIVSTSGQLQTSGALDYEAKSSYSVTVSVSDGNGGSDSISVTINVTDVDETPANNVPEFTEGSSATRAIAENTASGSNIGTAVSATDADNDTLTYSLGGTDAASFSIDTATGQLQTSAALDYETKTSYSVTVSVSDGNGGNDSITVTINVTDVNEDVEAPVSIISSSITTCSISHKSGDVYDVTIEGTLTTSQSVRHLTVYGYVNGGSQIGTDSIGFLDPGETKNFSITGDWTHDGSTSQECFVIYFYQKVPGAPSAQPLPAKTVLLPNFPNPFNPETWVPYQLAKPAEVTLTIYNMRGVVVRQLKLGHKAAGVYTSRSRAIHWDGRNMFGEKVATGVYFYTLTAGDFAATRKMLIMK